VPSAGDLAVVVYGAGHSPGGAITVGAGGLTQRVSNQGFASYDSCFFTVGEAAGLSPGSYTPPTGSSGLSTSDNGQMSVVLSPTAPPSPPARDSSFFAFM
jgi:hypothetical protein